MLNNPKFSLPEVSIVICTRNRGASAIATIESALANTHPNFEVMLVDQSTNDRTKAAINPFLSLPHFRYVPTDTVGAGSARQIGLQEARGEVVAYTDDDCTVTPDWLSGLSAIFQQNERVAIVCCRVDPAPYDQTKGYVPCYEIKKNRTLRTMRDCFHGLGLGAGMAVRRRILLSIGGFDRNLGPGSVFRAGEDHDIFIRAILNNCHVYETPEIAVLHFGMRTWTEGKEHSKRDWFSGGATYIKPVKCGYLNAGIMLVSYPMLR